jgi:hypothetical protein
MPYSPPHLTTLIISYPQAGKAPTPVAVLANATSAALRLVNPDRVSPPALFHFGSSSAMTVSGASPAFKRRSSVDDSTFAGPTLNVQDTSAPY